ncbi:hypothetical protein QQP08_021750 [Theobroma cacao]|nr:hypothetical protein QQP08_021750 [Theobroma cacao]
MSVLSRTTVDVRWVEGACRRALQSGEGTPWPLRPENSIMLALDQKSLLALELSIWADPAQPSSRFCGLRKNRSDRIIIQSLSLSCPVSGDRPNNSTLLQLNQLFTLSMAEVIPFGAVSNIVLSFLASPILLS